jgi:hypothetical protein
MALSGEIRNRDVALDLLKEAGTPAGSELSARWIEEKKQFQSDLSRLLRRWPKRGLSRKWSSRLGLR